MQATTPRNLPVNPSLRVRLRAACARLFCCCAAPQAVQNGGLPQAGVPAPAVQWTPLTVTIPPTTPLEGGNTTDTLRLLPATQNPFTLVDRAADGTASDRDIGTLRIEGNALGTAAGTVIGGLVTTNPLGASVGALIGHALAEQGIASLVAYGKKKYARFHPPTPASTPSTRNSALQPISVSDPGIHPTLQSMPPPSLITHASTTVPAGASPPAPLSTPQCPFSFSQAAPSTVSFPLSNNTSSLKEWVSGPNPTRFQKRKK